jgi:hypothetical protein
MRGKRAKALRRVAFAISQHPNFKDQEQPPQTWPVK